MFYARLRAPMDAADLIANLASLERAAAKEGDLVTRACVIEMQEWVWRTQRENLELRRENQNLRHRVEILQLEAEGSHQGAAAAVRGQSSQPAWV
ncbi:MAG: hypothetical protein ACRD25_10140 [Terracidiphilus sp.]